MSAEADNSVNVSMAARQYIGAGLILVSIDSGKGPTHKGWNLRENCITTMEQASNLYGSIGIAHAYSRTCCIDVDNNTLALLWFQGVGIDLQAYYDASDAVRWTSGRAGRYKLVYRLPDHIALLTTKSFSRDGGVELRCATTMGLTVQDVLPPSIHPLTGQPYRWLGPCDFRNIPQMPADLLAFWLTLMERKAAAGSTAPLGACREDIQTLLQCFKPDPTDDYDIWFKVGCALHHETGASEVGLDLWDEWSKDGRRYKGREVLEYKWSTLQLDHENPVTIHTLEKFAGMRLSMASEFKVIADDPAPVNSSGSKNKFKIETATEFADCEYEDDFIDDVLPDAAYGVIMGQSGSGKTFVAIDLAFAMARGVRWRNKDTKPARVLYIAAEGAVGVRKRLKAYAQHHGIDLASINVEFLGAAPDLTRDTDLPALIASINARRAIICPAGQAVGGSLVLQQETAAFTHTIIDTWSQVTPGADENSSHDMGAALKRVQHLHRATGARILFVAHMGKDVTKGMRGWSGFKAAMDYEIEVTRNGAQRSITLSKSRDSLDGVTFAFHLHAVAIGSTKRGKPVVSCVVVHEGAPRRPPVGKVQTAVLATVELYCEANNGAWMPGEETLQKAKNRLPLEKGKRDQRGNTVRSAISSLITNKWLEQKDGNYRPFSNLVDL